RQMHPRYELPIDSTCKIGKKSSADVQKNSTSGACQPLRARMKTVRIAIIQSCYVPWRGFFDLIGRCDEYVIFDRVQYVKRHWHNRNRIKTSAGVQWLTIPVLSKGRYKQPIDEVGIEKPWAEKHWRTLELAYRRAPFFEALAPTVSSWYERADKEKRLTDVNALFLHEIASLLGLGTRIVRDTVYP